MSTFVFEQLEPHGELVTSGATPAQRAAQIVADAQQQAVEIEAEARTRGEAAGYADGLARAQAELGVPIAAFQAATAALETARDEVAAAVERRAVELALTIAERIVGAAIDAEPELVCNVVEGALRRLVDRDRVVVDLNPDDLEIIGTWLGEQPASAAAAVELRGERRVPRGGCVVRTREGEIDARVPEQLERAAETLRDAIAARRA